MKGDFSRDTFDPKRHYRRVLKQQGRVDVDADSNEQVAIDVHIGEATTYDVIGPSGVPLTLGADGTPLPGGFAIGLTDDGADLTVSPGRMYVEGVLCENDDPKVVTLLKYQPDLPFHAVPKLIDGTYVIYLDVFESLQTAIDNPLIREKALGGPDTACRAKTVWQVKAAPIDAGATCATAAASYRRDFSKAGKMLAQTGALSVDPLPCILPPQTGYRSLENQLYRVEIHKPGGFGTATFKWSRENGSVVAAVVAPPGSDATTAPGPTFHVSSLGHDAETGFTGRLDWIEALDDNDELNVDAGAAGTLLRVMHVDRTALTITTTTQLARPLDLMRHAKLRRWEQTGDGLDNGIVIANGNPIPLEQGIEVAFSDGDFRVGDYWLIPARTATDQQFGMIEWPVDEATQNSALLPPRGVVHHYAPLAIVVYKGKKFTIVEDCRPQFEDLVELTKRKYTGCCTATVQPGEDIQAAIDNLPDAGGCVCLKPGCHVIQKPLSIAGWHNVRLVGESAGAVVKIDAPEPALLIEQAEGIEVSGIHFIRTHRGSEQGVVHAIWTHGCILTGCRVEDGPQEQAAPTTTSIGIQLLECSGLRVVGCIVNSALIGILALGGPGFGSIGDLSFEGNRIMLGKMGQWSPPLAGIVIQDVSGICRVEANVIVESIAGIVVNDDMTTQPPHSHARAIVARNFVKLYEPPTDVKPDAQIVAIDVAGDCSVVTQNVVALTRASIAHVGIRVTGSGTQVVENHLTPPSLGKVNGIGIQVGYSDGTSSVLTIGVRVSGNLVVGYLCGILANTAIDTIIESNTISLGVDTQSAAEACGVALNQSWGTAVCGNTIASCMLGILSWQGLGNRIAANTIANGMAGITVMQEFGPAIAQNRIAGLAWYGIGLVVTAERCEVVENRLTNCGSAGLFGIAAWLVWGELHVEANEVTDTGLSVDGQQVADLAFGIAGIGLLEARVEGNLVTYSDLTKRKASSEDRALLMGGLYDYTLKIIVSNATQDWSLGFGVQILGNRFTGTGQSALVELAQAQDPNIQSINGPDVWASFYYRFARVFFSNNYCLHLTAQVAGGLEAFAPSGNGATVVLCGRAATVTGNQIRAAIAASSVPFALLTDNQYPSFDFKEMPGPCIANVTSGPMINHDATPLDNSFNMIQ